MLPRSRRKVWYLEDSLNKNRKNTLQLCRLCEPQMLSALPSLRSALATLLRASPSPGRESEENKFSDVWPINLHLAGRPISEKKHHSATLHWKRCGQHNPNDKFRTMFLSAALFLPKAMSECQTMFLSTKCVVFAEGYGLRFVETSDDVGACIKACF